MNEQNSEAQVSEFDECDVAFAHSLGCACVYSKEEYGAAQKEWDKHFKLLMQAFEYDGPLVEFDPFESARVLKSSLLAKDAEIAALKDSVNWFSEENRLLMQDAEYVSALKAQIERLSSALRKIRGINAAVYNGEIVTTLDPLAPSPWQIIAHEAIEDC